ncbi:MAG: alpha/beta hydrolase family esterase [Panacagrimonas sp.]
MKTSLRVLGALALLALGMGSTQAAPVTGTIDPVSGILTLSGPLTVTWPTINGVPVRTPQGTKSYGATLTVNGQSRRYLVIRPDPVPAKAPVMLLLHPANTLPEYTANFTYVADFVATQAFWAVLPAAQNGAWKGETSQGDADMRFLSALIDTLVAQGVDGDRISVAGYSSGGTLAQRMVCQAPERIAAIGVVASMLPYSLWTSCKPSVQRPKVYVLGTDDPIVPYYGYNGFGSAANLMNYWAQKQACSGAASMLLPDRVSDGTQVQLDERTGCAGGKGLRMYTVEGGGHAWPGGQTDSAGITSRDMAATGAIWSFVRGYRR